MLAHPKNLLTEGVKIAKKLNTLKRNASFHVILSYGHCFQTKWQNNKKLNHSHAEYKFSHNFELCFLFSEKVLKLQKK